MLSRIITHPFTVPLTDLPIKVEVKELSEGTHRVPFQVTCKYLLHADPCLGYRVTVDGKTITYCTDTGICDNSLELSKDSDVLIHECGTKAGLFLKDWPHTNPEEAANLAKNANTVRLFLSHFNPLMYDSIKERKEAEAAARKVFKNTVAAMDGVSTDI